MTDILTDSRPTDRLFLALFPDAVTAASIAQLTRRLRAKHGLHGRPIGTDRFHLSLYHLGDYVGLRQDIVDRVNEAAVGIVAQPFEVTLDRALSFSGNPRRQPFVLRSNNDLDGLRAFRETLGVALIKTGLGRYLAPQFTPHITLLYDKQNVPEVKIEPVSWRVSEFVLVHSLIGQTQYLRRGRWPLRG